MLGTLAAAYAEAGRFPEAVSVAEKALELIETLSADIARAIYNRASLATHVETTQDEVVQLKRYIDTMLFDLLAIR